MAFPWLAAATAAGAGAQAFMNRNAGRDAKRAQDAANLANKEMMWEQHNFEERMSSTAYQRAVQDMRMAGLNPMVMMQGAGGPSSTPSGSMAVAQSGAEQVLASGLEQARTVGNAVGRSLETLQRDAELKLRRAEEKLVTQQTASARWQAELNENLAAKTREEAYRANMENELFRSSLPSAKAHAEINKDLVVPDAVLERLGKVSGALGSLGGAAILRGGLKGSRRSDYSGRRDWDWRQ